MTKKELSQLYYLNKEIKQEKHKLAELESTATDTSVKISGLPHVNNISNKTALAAEISDAKAIIQAKINLSVVEYNKLNRYVAGIEDSLIRQIVNLRYVMGLSWYQVECRIGGDNKSESLRKKLNRYLLSPQNGQE